MEMCIWEDEEEEEEEEWSAWDDVGCALSDQVLNAVYCSSAVTRMIQK